MNESSTTQLERLERIVSGQLPAFNDAYLAGRMTLEEEADLLRPAVEALVSSIAKGSGLSRPVRERAQVVTGFVTGTVERHAQSEGRAMNDGMALFDGYETMLLALAGEDLPIRDTARSFWLLNRCVFGEKLLTYTSDRGERFFNQQVNQVNDALETANAVMRVLTSTGGTVSTASAAESLTCLPSLIREYKAAYTGFRRRDEEGLPITPEFFTFTFRTFLPAVSLGGEMRQGPNAAWLACVFSFDALFGTATTWYRKYAADKMPYLAAEEGSIVADDLNGWSVMDVLAAMLRLPAGLASVSSEDLASRLVLAGPDMITAAKAVRDAWLELNKGTKAHGGLVRDFLDKPSMALSEADLQHMAVMPGEGTGGGTREQLAQISEMRVACVAARALTEALRLFEGPVQVVMAA